MTYPRPSYEVLEHQLIETHRVAVAHAADAATLRVELAAAQVELERLRVLEAAYVDAFGAYSPRSHALIKMRITGGAP